jgi:uncharacterized Rmd1/YagE family protein
MSEFGRRKNVLILAEGYEEKPYIDKILSFPNVNLKTYYFPPVINVKGNCKIVARYQYEIQRGFNDVILVFCDADKGSSQFLNIVNEIGEQFFIDKKYGLKVFIFANPVTLQIVLSHFGDVILKKVSKKKNADIVKKLTGIANYDAKEKQIKSIIEQIHFSSIDILKERLRIISTDFMNIPSTNFLHFLELCESGDCGWIDAINSLRKK